MHRDEGAGYFVHHYIGLSTPPLSIARHGLRLTQLSPVHQGGGILSSPPPTRKLITYQCEGRGMIEDTLYDTFRAAMRLGPDAKSFGADKDSVVVSTESENVIYTITLNDSRMKERGCTGLCQRDPRYDKEHIEQDLSQMNISEDTPARDTVFAFMMMDLHEFTHWADEHHDDTESYEEDNHSERWGDFFIEEVLLH